MNFPSLPANVSSLIFTSSCFSGFSSENDGQIKEVQATLQLLADQYTLYLVRGGRTGNVADGINQFFKPTLPSQAEISTGGAYLVGRFYHQEMIPALQTGIKTIWFNPARGIAPGLLPLHTYEITGMHQLPEALMKVPHPDYPYCLHWLLEKGASALLLAHVHLVASLAYLIGCWFRAKNVLIDPILTHRAGILHDLAKMDALQTSEDHGSLGAAWLSEHHFPEIAEITRRHVLDAILDPQRKPRTWEEKIVYYTDKISEKASLVPVEKRIRKLAEQYPQNQDEINHSLVPVLALQNEICEVLQIPTGEFLSKLKNALKHNPA